MSKIKLYFKGWWRALIGRGYFITDKEAYGCNTSKPVDMNAMQNV